jgi:hypothetical protein
MMSERHRSNERDLSAALLTCLSLLALVQCVQKRDEPLGGKWFIQWETSQLAESGGHHPFLHRGTPLINRRVEENTWRYRYLGDDCVLYVAGNSNRGELLAACGDNRPVMIAPHMDDYVNGDIADGGLKGDPIIINGVAIPVRDIKVRAGLPR